MADRRVPKRRGSRVTRREALAGIVFAGSTVVLANRLVDTDAFTNALADRETTVQIGDDSTSVVGLLVSDPVKRNQQELLVQITNNASETITTTVSLGACADGTLFGPDGGFGCTVTFDVLPGQTRDVDIDSAVAGGTVVPFTIAGEQAATGFSFSIPRQTTVETGNNPGAVSIDKLRGFAKNAATDEWTIDRIDVSSNNADLDRIEIRVAELSTGTIVSSLDITNITGTKYSEKGQGNQPAFVLQPDTTGYTVQNGITYELRVTAFDVLGNFASDTRQA